MKYGRLFAETERISDGHTGSQVIATRIYRHERHFRFEPYRQRNSEVQTVNRIINGHNDVVSKNLHQPLWIRQYYKYI